MEDSQKNTRMTEIDSWSLESKYVLKELERLNNNIERLELAVKCLEVTFSAQKARSSIFGGLAGAFIAFVIMLIREYLLGK